MNARSFEQQLAVITGGASGIGLACAELLAERGAKVLLLDRQIDAARAAAQAWAARLMRSTWPMWRRFWPWPSASRPSTDRCSC
jgi:NADP-dependent 3-hydroxy acid dehydrogenase YdfG